MSAEYDKNFLHFDQYFNSRLYPNDAIFYRGLNVYLFKFGEIHKRRALIEKKLLKLDEFFKIQSNANPILSDNIKSDLASQIIANAKIKKLSNLNLYGYEWNIIEPTIIIMEGHNEIHGTVSKQLTISGTFMMVKNKGSFSMSNVKLKPSMEFEIANRNWSGSLNAFDSKVSLSNVSVIGSKAEDGINLVGGSLSADKINFSNTRSDALDLDFSDAMIGEINCQNIGNDCVDTSEAQVKISKLTAFGVGDKVISAGENSVVNVEKFQSVSSAIAAVSKDGSNLIINHMSLQNVELAVAAFNKKPEYNFPKINIKKIEKNNRKGEWFEALLGENATAELPKNILKVVYKSEEVEAKLYGAQYGVATEK